MTASFFVPQDRIAYVSELYFSDQFLYINDGYGVSWLKTLDAVEALPADLFVPGHGLIPQDPRETRQGLHRFRQMLVALRDAVQKEIARGATEDQAAAAINFPQYEKTQGYKSRREVVVRRGAAARLGETKGLDWESVQMAEEMSKYEDATPLARAETKREGQPEVPRVFLSPFSSTVTSPSSTR